MQDRLRAGEWMPRRLPHSWGARPVSRQPFVDRCFRVFGGQGTSKKAARLRMGGRYGWSASNKHGNAELAARSAKCTVLRIVIAGAPWSATSFTSQDGLSSLLALEAAAGLPLQGRTSQVALVPSRPRQSESSRRSSA